MWTRTVSNTSEWSRTRSRWKRAEKKKTKQKQAICSHLVMELTGETIQPKIPIFIFGKFQWQMAVSRIFRKRGRADIIIKLKMRVLRLELV